jgi:hypothetical protein
MFFSAVVALLGFSPFFVFIYSYILFEVIDTDHNCNPNIAVFSDHMLELALMSFRVGHGELMTFN